MTILLQNGAGNNKLNDSIMNKNLKLASYVLKRYEPNLDTFFFYNLSTEKFWETDFFTGSVISQLQGQFSREEIVDILLSNNTKLSEEQLKSFIYGVFDFLFNEGFLIEAG